MTARSANCDGNRYLYGMRPEYQCSLDGSHRGVRVTTRACPSTRRANSAVQTARIRKLQDIVAIKQFYLKDREKELICAPAGQAGAGRKPSRGGHGARHIIEEAFQTQTGIPSALSVRDGEEHFKGVGRGQLSAFQERGHGQQDGGVPKRPRWSRPAEPTGHGSEQGVGGQRRLNPAGRRIQPLLLLLPASQLPPTGWSAFVTPIKKSEQAPRQYSTGCYTARQRW
jgi:hypothetical protein